MTLNKADLIRGVIEKVHLKKRKREKQQYLFPELNYTLLSRKQAAHAVDSLIEIIKSSLEKGEQVLISGFGKFYVRFKWARKGRNPRTGKEIFLDSRRIVAFHCSSKLKERMNKSGDRSQKPFDFAQGRERIERPEDKM
jgi:integration host factor subunit alpha